MGDTQFSSTQNEHPFEFVLCLLFVAAILPLFFAQPSFALPRVAATPTPAVQGETLYLPLVQRANSAPTDRRPSWGAPIAISPGDGALWVVNPDSDSVTVLDTEQFSSTEINVGQEPWSLALSPSGDRVYVVNRASGTLSVIDAGQRQLQTNIAVGPEPGAIALSPSGSQAYVTVTAADRVAVVDTAQLTVTSQISVAALPYAIAVTNEGEGNDRDQHIWVTHLLAFAQPTGAEATDDGRIGRVSVVDAATLTVTKNITLAADEHGFPNLLTAISLSATHAWVPHVRAAPALPNRLTTTIFAAVDTLDLANQSEMSAARLSLNDQVVFGSPVNNPVAAIPSPDGKTLYMVLAGSNLVEIVDIAVPTHPRLVKFLPTGLNPRGLALSADGRRGYVMNYLSRSVSVLDLVQQRVLDEVPVTEERLPPPVLRGKILFNSSADPRLTQGSWFSCASCHPDGGTDGVTWMFPDGPRQTPALWNASQTLPWHWSAALDEPQDVEETVQIIQHGLGLAPGADPPQLGTPNAGRSPDLDALATYVQQGIRAPAIPPPSAEAERGRVLFVSAGCVDCHGGAHWTTSHLPGSAGGLDPDGNGMVDEVLRQVGTLNPLDVRGANGFDVPSLLAVGLTPPYLHDGSQPTLAALLASGHPNPNAGGNGLNPDEIVALATFLRSIGPTTPPLKAP